MSSMIFDAAQLLAFQVVNIVIVEGQLALSTLEPRRPTVTTLVLIISLLISFSNQTIQELHASDAKCTSQTFGVIRISLFALAGVFEIFLEIAK
ncbi:MAG: hypothetical protein IPJ38_04360 [Dechloromonas sp.]|uniref:Uncharacterized protein n=1 Tax=Candidatus Dechloromonas phosphorivorans TaxID=2899244 RepID=A0A935K0T2_9RHOO|nr:hypothetical protein [Candidatus Dechloromonas phosphorivorans]